MLEIRPSARKHGTSDGDIRWAVENAIGILDVESDQPENVSAMMYVGPDRSGRWLEVLVIVGDDDERVAIHAMRLRKQYRRLLG